MRLTHRPVPHEVTQGFGVGATRGRPHPIYGDYQPVGHLATDHGAPANTPVVAAAGGTVAYSGWGQNMPAATAAKYGYIAGPAGEASGIIIIIDHGDGTAHAISHLNRADVHTGQRVNGGQVIGLSGSTGRSTGPHVHFEYMTLPINYGSPYYSRLDPMAQYGGGIKTVGTTNPQEEDDMASPEVMHLLKDIAARVSVTNNTAKDAAARVSVVNDNLKGIESRIRGDIGTVHNTIIRDVGSQLGNIQKGVNQKVNVDTLAKELAGKLEQRDLQALAEKLTITVKGK